MPAGTLELLKTLVAIDSVNPSLVAGGAGEREIATFIAGWARDSGLEADVLERTPGRPSVVVRAGGRGGGRTLLLCGHCDTVSVEGMRDPFAPRVEGDRLHGRGACDMKAGVAAALVACREAAARGLAGDVVVAAVADEEHSSLGVQEVLAGARRVAAHAARPRTLRGRGRRSDRGARRRRRDRRARRTARRRRALGRRRVVPRRPARLSGNAGAGARGGGGRVRTRRRDGQGRV
jgi:hypothetical protein